jgi:hypothetical protein
MFVGRKGLVSFIICTHTIQGNLREEKGLQLLMIVDFKGLSHEIDFKILTKTDRTTVGRSKGRGWFLNFLGAQMIS